MTIEEIEKRWGSYSHSSGAWSQHQQDIRWLINRVKELEKHTGMETGDLGDYHYKVVELKRRIKELEEGLIETLNHIEFYDPNWTKLEELYKLIRSPESNRLELTSSSPQPQSPIEPTE